jgi:antitoxin ParD1/3/4
MISADPGPRLERYVTELVDPGRYGSKSEVLREGIRLVEGREKRLVLLDATLERGLAGIGAWRTHALEDVTDELAQRYATAASKTA